MAIEWDQFQHRISTENKVVVGVKTRFHGYRVLCYRYVPDWGSFTKSLDPIQFECWNEQDQLETSQEVESLEHAEALMHRLLAPVRLPDGTSPLFLCKDALEGVQALPEESVNCIVTDPAYESLEKHRKQGTTTRLKKSKGSSNAWFPVVPNAYLEPFFEACYKALKKNSYIFVFCDDETSDVVKPALSKAGFTVRKRLVWVKLTENPQPQKCRNCDARVKCKGCGRVYKHHNMFTGMGYPFRASYEFVVFAQKGKRKPPEDRSLRDTFVLMDPMVRNKKAYPTEKPVELIKSLIRQSTGPGDLVLDPFAGSGAALKAAYELDRRSVGYDVLQSTVDRFLLPDDGEKGEKKMQEAKPDQQSQLRGSQSETILDVLDMMRTNDGDE